MVFSWFYLQNKISQTKDLKLKLLTDVDGCVCVCVCVSGSDRQIAQVALLHEFALFFLPHPHFPAGLLAPPGAPPL